MTLKAPGAVPGGPGLPGRCEGRYALDSEPGCSAARRACWVSPP